MRRRWMSTLLVGTFVLAFAGVALAQDDGDRAKKKRRATGKDRAKRSKQFDPARVAKMLTWRAIKSLRAVAELPEAKEAAQAFAKEMQPFLRAQMETQRNLMTELRKAKAEGVGEGEIKQIIESAKEKELEIANEITAAQVKFIRALADVAEANPGKVTAKAMEGMVRRTIKARRAGKTGDRKKRRKGGQKRRPPKGGKDVDRTVIE